MTYHYWYVPTHGRHRPRWARRHSDSREASVRSRAWRGWVASADEAAVAVAAGAGLRFGNDGPTLPRGMRDELEAAEGRDSGFAESYAGGREGPGGARRTRRTRRSRRPRVCARPQTGAQGGEGARQGAAAGVEHPQIARQGTRRRRRRRRWRRSGPRGARRRRRRRPRRAWRAPRERVEEARARDQPSAALGAADRDDDRRGRPARGASDEKKSRRRRDPDEQPGSEKPVKLTPEQRMSTATLDAFRRDEAEQKRLLKKLKGRSKGPDDGLGLFMDALPGVELLDDDDDPRRRGRGESLSEAAERASAAASTRAANASRRDAMESDESEDDEEMTAFAAEDDDDDPFGLGADSDAEEEDSDEDEDDDPFSLGADSDSDEDGSDGDRAEGESASDLDGDGPDSEEPPRGESRAATPADSAGKYVPPRFARPRRLPRRKPRVCPSPRLSPRRTRTPRGARFAG